MPAVVSKEPRCGATGRTGARRQGVKPLGIRLDEWPLRQWRGPGLGNRSFAIVGASELACDRPGRVRVVAEVHGPEHGLAIRAISGERAKPRKGAEAAQSISRPALDSLRTSWRASVPLERCERLMLPIGAGALGEGRPPRWRELHEIAKLAEAVGFATLLALDHLLFRQFSANVLSERVFRTSWLR